MSSSNLQSGRIESANAGATSRVTRKLSLVELVDALMVEGLVETDAAAQFKHERRYYQGATHPLVLIAEQRWKSLKPPHRVLDLDSLTQWMAGWDGLN